MHRLCTFLAAVFVAAIAATSAFAGPSVSYGIQDDAWLQYGPGTVEERVTTLQRLGLDIVRVTVRWDAIEQAQGTFDWTGTDAILGQLHDAGIEVVVTLYGTPEWANGGKAPNVVPIRGADFATFAGAAAERYSYVHRWTVWNEPNQRRWLSTASPAQYVTRLLNPAYTAIHAASPSSKVGGGVTAPRGGTGGLSPVAFIRGMGARGARLDAYAHHPYALAPGESPWSGGCEHCETITMATLDRLVTETAKAFKRPVRLWLTELGYQSNPPDRLLGVTPAMQASYIAAAAYKAWATPRVDLLIQYLYRDEPSTDRWQSGLVAVGGATKLAIGGFEAPLAQASRKGSTTAVWGTIRRGTGARPYRLQRFTSSGWLTIGGVQRTRPDGTLQRKLPAVAGTRLRLLANAEPGNTLVVR
jgi:hypothetical protein